MTKNHSSVPKCPKQVVGVPTRCTKRHMYQNAPNVEKRTRRDRRRCDVLRPDGVARASGQRLRSRRVWMS